MASENLKVLTTENWDTEVLNAPGPVIVDFWAPWCGPCRMISPAFEGLAEEYTGKMTFGKLDTDTNGTIAEQYDIMTIPTFKVFQDGKVIKQLDRVRNLEQLKQFIDECFKETEGQSAP